MNRSRSQVDAYYNRNISLHKPGVIPNSSRLISPITANRHKYELKQRIWPKRTVESWFANHSSDERRAVYSFLNTLYDADGTNKKDDRQPERRRKSPSPRLPHQVNTATGGYSSQRRTMSSDSRASKRDLGEVLESLESFLPSSSAQEKGVQTSSGALPVINGTKADRYSKRPSTSIVKHTETIQPQNSTDNTSNENDDENNKANRRYLSHTWRVINPREDVETNVRPDNNTSSFFNYTKKSYPEYFFIHPDWY